jgi:hypothetical protein
LAETHAAAAATPSARHTVAKPRLAKPLGLIATLLGFTSEQA